MRSVVEGVPSSGAWVQVGTCDTLEWAEACVEHHRRAPLSRGAVRQHVMHERDAVRRLYDDLTDEKLTPVDAIFWAVLGGLSALVLGWLMGVVRL